MKSLKAQHHKLSDTHEQIEILEHGANHDDAYKLVPFQQKLEESNLFPLKPTQMEIFQINVGKMCNQVCKHCHVDAGPDRKEIMTRETMQQCLDVLAANSSFTTVDLTGGAPELNPDFRWFVEEIKKLNKHIIVRCNLVYNPAGAFLPPSQESLEKEFKTALKKDFNISFHSLFAITNLPVSRFLDYLLQSNNYEKYMEKLLAAYNPVAAANVMCRNTISVGWDGYIYDCDFNQMLELKVDCSNKHILNFDSNELRNRSIVINQHCFGCTAGAGSSCGGAVT